MFVFFSKKTQGSSLNTIWCFIVPKSKYLAGNHWSRTESQKSGFMMIHLIMFSFWLFYMALYQYCSNFGKKTNKIKKQTSFGLGLRISGLFCFGFFLPFKFFVGFFCFFWGWFLFACFVGVVLFCGLSV